jgi:hypothetical protein
LDDLAVGEVSRTDLRKRLDRIIERPLDEEKAKQYDRDHFGTPEQIEESNRSSVWDGATYGG